MLPEPRQTKIVCALGPACKGSVWSRLVAAGMNVGLNFAHGTQEEHGAWIRRIRELSERQKTPVATLQDLAGPKVRRGEVPDGEMNLEAGDEFFLFAGSVTGCQKGVTVNYPQIIAETPVAAAILTSTDGGGTARLSSRFRPPNPILALTSRAETRRRLCLSWGVLPRLPPPIQDIDEMLRLAEQVTVAAGLLHPGDRVIITAGTPGGSRGTTNLIKAATIA